MSDIQLQQEHRETFTAVSNLFIDYYMPVANGAFVKVYLCLLRCMDACADRCSVSGIADSCNLTENDVLRAFRYWEKAGLLRLDHDAGQELSGVVLLQPKAEDDSSPEPDPYHNIQHTLDSLSKQELSSASNADTDKEDSTISNIDNSSDIADDTGIHAAPASNITQFRIRTAAPRHEYSADEINRFRKDETVRELFFVVETYLKRPLGATEVNTVLYWYDGLHFASDLIIYLVEYCISKGHSSLRYMDKVAMNWKDEGVSTMEEAKSYTAHHSQAYYGVMKAFGIAGRNLTDEEALYVKRWTEDYGFELPLVLEACKRTMSAIHQPSFEYTDAILANWQKNQVHTMADVEALDAAYAKGKKKFTPPKPQAKTSSKFHNFNQRDYDYDQLEKMLLNSSNAQ